LAEGGNLQSNLMPIVPFIFPKVILVPWIISTKGAKPWPKSQYETAISINSEIWVKEMHWECNTRTRITFFFQIEEGVIEMWAKEI
jgi:hypothetical protein